MTATMNAIANGNLRKNLASRLDRLDGILDGLADGLNDAVASAVQGAVAVAVQEAVRGILAEVLANPDVLARLRGLVSQTASATSTATTQAAPAAQKSRLGNVVAKVGSCCRLGWRSVRKACASLVGRVTNVLSTLQRRWQLVRQFRVPLLTAVVVGAVVGFGAYCGGPYVAAVAGWIAGFTTTLTVQASIWLRHILEGSSVADL